MFRSSVQVLSNTINHTIPNYSEKRMKENAVIHGLIVKLLDVHLSNFFVIKLFK